MVFKMNKIPTSNKDFILKLRSEVPKATQYRRRMETEVKAKVVASVWGQIYSIPCPSNCFASVVFKEKDEFNQFPIDRGSYSTAMP